MKSGRPLPPADIKETTDETKEDKSTPELVFVSTHKRVPQFTQLFSTPTRNQLVRRLQQGYRAKHKKNYEGKEREILQGSLSTTTQFVAKPTGELARKKIRLIAACVNEGRLHELPFSEPHFLFYLNEALRLDLIKSADLVLAPTVIHSDAKSNFDRPQKYAAIKKHVIGEEKEFFPLSRMKNALPSDEKTFQAELLQIPASERCYYTVNLSHKQEMAFLFSLIFAEWGGVFARKKTVAPILKAYLNRFKSEADKAFAATVFKELDDDEELYLSKSIRDELMKFMSAKESVETMRYCELDTSENPLTSGGSYNFHNANNTLLMSFLLEMGATPSQELDVFVSELSLGKNENLFKQHLASGMGEEAAKLICDSGWESSFKQSDNLAAYKYFYSKGKYSLAVQVMWRTSTKSGQEYSLCALLHDEESSRADDKTRGRFKGRIASYLESLSDEKAVKIKKWLPQLDSNVRQASREAAREIMKLIGAEMSPLARRFFSWSEHAYLAKGSIRMSWNSAQGQGSNHLPWFVVSPDYNPDDVNSPLLCAMTFTLGAFTCAMHAIYGKRAIGAVLSHGANALADYRVMQENPSLLGLLRPHKPVELFYPTINETHDVHSNKLYAGELIRHDLVTHNFMYSEEPYKALLHYFARLISFEKNVRMSKAIYNIADLGSVLSGCPRDASDEKAMKSYQRRWLYNMIPYAAGFEGGQQNFWQNISAHDDWLLFVIDAYLQNKQWQHHFGSDPIEGLPSQHEAVEQVIAFLTLHSVARPQQRLYYLLAYRLSLVGYPNNVLAARSIVGMMREINLNDLFQWERNGGLYLRDDFFLFDKRKFFHPSSDQFRELLQLLTPHVSSIIHFSPQQASIFYVLARHLRDDFNQAEWFEILKHIDLSKICRFKASDKRLYFVDLNTNNREPNLLTEIKLSDDEKKRADQIKDALKKAYQLTPQLFDHVDASYLKLLRSHDEKASEVKKENFALSVTKNILRWVNGDNQSELKYFLSSSYVSVSIQPAFVLETALHNAKPETILLLLQSEKVTVNLRCLKILAERQRSSKSIDDKKIFADILFHVMRLAKQPDAVDKVMINNLFHPEFLFAKNDFFHAVLERTNQYSLTTLLQSPSALTWWMKLTLRDIVWHDDAQEIVRMVAHPSFPQSSVPDVQKAAAERQAAFIPLVSKLSVSDRAWLDRVLERCLAKPEAKSAIQFHPSENLVRAIKDEIRDFRKKTRIYTIGMWKKSMKIQIAFETAMDNLDKISDTREFMNFKVQGGLSIVEALQYHRKIALCGASTDSMKRVLRAAR